MTRIPFKKQHRKILSQIRMPEGRDRYLKITPEGSKGCICRFDSLSASDVAIIQPRIFREGWLKPRDTKGEQPRRFRERHEFSFAAK